MEDLTRDSILNNEFEYIAQTAFQAHEDRTKVSHLYILSLGSFIAAILSSQHLGGTKLSYWVFTCVFILLTLNGLLTLLQLVRLRLAWHESAKAMNAIKNYYKNKLAENIDTALVWSSETMPKPYKSYSISRILSIQVAILGAFCLGATIYFAGKIQDKTLTNVAIGLGILYAFIQIALYKGLLFLWRESEC